MESHELVSERRGAVLVLRLNRPEARNALTMGLLGALVTAITEAESDPGVRAVVLTGTGSRAFCAGMDLKAFAEGDTRSSDAGPPDSGADVAAFDRILRGDVGVPLVGAANASALAGGLELLLGCDLIVASSAAEFGLPEVKRGLFAAGNGTSIGTRIPLGIALEMALTGASISAQRAFEIGLINAVVGPDDVVDTAVALAERIAANAPLGLAATKDLVRLAVTDPGLVPERLDEWRAVVFTSDDATEGATAFVEKREPRWTGR